ncbi:LysR family transcriptional regulator [Celerinatantimonas sp. MCCC 1A17872]|uniref:LysR family transcriptional regulator n=1 Tax=Celerinatantimonas sp. MCCC 1A17872 TaxID=3177514 RepID=UPI0038BF9B8A
MDIKRIKYFCTVVEHGSISKAAKVLHMAQPPLSKRIMELEEELGVTLFNRTARKIELTENGLYFYRNSLNILNNLTNLQQQMIAIGSNKKSIINIGVSYLYSRYSRPLISLLHQHDFDVRVAVSDSSHLEKLLKNKQIDFALLQEPSDHSFIVNHSLKSVPLMAICHKEFYSQTTEETISFKKLAKLPLILLHRIEGSGTFEVIQNIIYNLNPQANIAMRISDPQLIINLIYDKTPAIALLPKDELATVNHTNVNIYPVTTDIKLLKPSLIYMKGKKFNPVITDILTDFIQSHRH